uniref:hypothetical protein n=1 Tax=Haslea karadagensis TaxID=1146996 RepID=UPI00220034C2|nr:hypothetical protein OOD24_mgp40 [Haslea karadagensis]UXN44258.1 hypothetical protein [Haslea karadagensis]
MKTRIYQRLLVKNRNDINWNKAESNLADLQYEILKAHRKEDCNKVLNKQITLSKNESSRAIWRKNGIID